MTAKVCKKCQFYLIESRKCSLTKGLRAAWDDACGSYELAKRYRTNG